MYLPIRRYRGYSVHETDRGGQQLGRRAEDADNPALALRAAQDILDRAGYKSADKVNVVAAMALVDAGKVRGMSTEDLVALRRRLSEAGGLAEAGE